MPHASDPRHILSLCRPPESCWVMQSSIGSRPSLVLFAGPPSDLYIPSDRRTTRVFQVLEVETVKLTPELRRRLPFLGHLPIHCDISFLEVDMEGFVSEETANKFREGSLVVGCGTHFLRCRWYGRRYLLLLRWVMVMAVVVL